MLLYYLGLGANTAGPRGTPRETLRWACAQLTDLGDVRPSSYRVTAPMHRTDQPDYLNLAAELRTGLSPTGLLRRLGEIESRGGRDRRRETRYGPRPLDLDILLVGDYLIASDRLTVPHPRMHLRPFVLGPLIELAPNLRDPRTHRLWRLYPAAQAPGAPERDGGGSRPAPGESI